MSLYSYIFENLLLITLSCIYPTRYTYIICGIYAHIKYYNDNQKKEYSKYSPGIYGLAAYVYRNEGLILNNVKDKKDYYLNYLLVEKCKLNKIYNDNKCFVLDIKILLASFNLKKYIKIKGVVYKPKLFCGKK